jgi:hypothetical protein
MNLVWHASRAEAVVVALAQKKKVFLLAGRASCGATTGEKKLLEDYAFPKIPPIHDLLEQCFVLWHADTNAGGMEWYEYVTGRKEFNLPYLAIIDPLTPGKVIDESAGIQDLQVLYKRLLKYAVGYNDPVPIPVEVPDIDSVRLMADFKKGIGRELLPEDIPKPWCGGMLLKPHVHFGGPYITWTDDATKTVVKNLQVILTFKDFLEKLYKPFPNVKAAIDADYTIGAPPVGPDPLADPIPPVIPPIDTEYEQVVKLINSIPAPAVSVKEPLLMIAKKVWGK